MHIEEGAWHADMFGGDAGPASDGGYRRVRASPRCRLARYCLRQTAKRDEVAYVALRRPELHRRPSSAIVKRRDGQAALTRSAPGVRGCARRAEPQPSDTTFRLNQQPYQQLASLGRAGVPRRTIAP